MRLNFFLILLSIILSVVLVFCADGKDKNSAVVTSGVFSHGNKKTTRSYNMHESKEGKDKKKEKEREDDGEDVD
jgi:hypothetical protein